MKKSIGKSPRFDDEFDDYFSRLLDLIKTGGERTRGTLYFLILISMSIIVPAVEYNISPWPVRRELMISNAYFCYKSGYPGDHLVVNPENIARNADGSNVYCNYYYKYIKDNYNIALTDGQGNLLKDSGNDDAIKDRYQQLSREYVEYNTTTIPIVGIKVDRNSIWIVIVSMIWPVFLVLRASVKNQIHCLVDFRLTKAKLGASTGAEYLDIGIVLLSHIFSGPRGNMKMVGAILAVPVVFSIFNTAQDWWGYRDLVTQLAGDVGMLCFYLGELVSSVLLVWAYCSCLRTFWVLDRELQRIADGIWSSA